ncbi:2-hydroxyacid dehydrogenase [Paraburkholderia youngii]|uniref:2-hydroxyacid dehydrogenase n=1 Tax=Paraburkholderia youngii TaxID=2782701 RepID=UPI003D21A37C
MTGPIAFISSMPSEVQDSYLASLRAAIPGENIVPFDLLTDAQRQRVDIAVVARPDPVKVAALPRLAWIQSMWAGVDQLLPALGSKAPPVVRLIDPEMSRTMSEAVLAWTYFLQRDMSAYARQQARLLWRQLPYRKPSQVSVGLLGMGELGTAAAIRLADAGFKVRGWSRSTKRLPGIETCSGESGLDLILRESDIVVCLLPLTPQTQGLLNIERLTQMKRGAALINFSRGPILVENDLLTMLEREHISHAVLDVFSVEPLPQESGLWRHSSVTVLPHISAPTDNETAATVFADNVRAYRSGGRIPANVDLSRGY